MAATPTQSKTSPTGIKYAGKYDLSLRLLRRPLPRMLELVGEAAQRANRVLEVGAGTGLVTSTLAERRVDAFAAHKYKNPTYGKAGSTSLNAASPAARLTFPSAKTASSLIVLQGLNIVSTSDELVGRGVDFEVGRERVSVDYEIAAAMSTPMIGRVSSHCSADELALGNLFRSPSEVPVDARRPVAF